MVEAGPYPILSDPASTVSATYGAAFQWKKGGILTNRQVTFVIDHDGVIRGRYEGNSKKLSCMVSGKGYDLLEVVDKLKDERQSIEVLKQHGESLRRAATLALQPIGPDTRDVLPVLRAALENEDQQIRIGAAASLCWLAPVAADAVPELIQATFDESDVVRHRAILALGRMGPDAAKSAIPTLIQSLAENSSTAVLALTRFGPAAKNGLARGLQDQDPRVRIHCFALLRGATVATDETRPGKPVVSVNMHDVKDLTETDLALLKDLPQLEKISFERTGVGNDGMEHLQDLKHLQELEFRLTNIGDTGLQYLAGLVNLRKLSIGETKVSDDGLVYLKGLTRLEHLILRGQGKRISDAGLAHLHELKNLQILDLGLGSKVTEEGIRAIKQVLPEIEVVWNQ